MILYHGSIVLVKNPEIRENEVFLDFGKGFYTTTSYEQAERWAKIKMRRHKANVGYVSIYDFDIDTAKKNAVIRQFNSADMEWLTFVINNRKGLPSEEDVDLHIGPVADDNVYTAIRLFETGVIDAEDTIKHLKTEVLQDQLTLHTEKILRFCRFIDSMEIR